MTHKKIIVGGLVAFIVLILIASVVYMKKSSTGENGNQDGATQFTSTNTPIDIALDFYDDWLDARHSTSTTPYASSLATEAILGEGLRTRLVASEMRAETDIDPVLCQTTLPDRVNGRIVSSQENEVRVLIMSKEKTLTAQSVFTLKKHGEGWYIDDILCSPGEFEEPREFSFEKEGHLLKNMLPPFNPEYWHIVYEENGQAGHVAPLFFTAESSCVALDTSTAPCAPDSFTEAKKVRIYGQMTETGVNVTRLQFLE